MNHRPDQPEFDEDGTVVAARDWLGNRFEIGDPVVYCVGAGRGQMMAVGVVKAIRSKEQRARNGRLVEPGETPDFSYTDVAGNVHSTKYEWTTWDDVTVQVLTYKTSGNWDNHKRTKPAWVNPMNITALRGLEEVAVKEVTGR